MRIEVIGEDESDNTQVRAYAEYRVFKVLARHAQRIRGAQVLLQRDECDGADDTVVCVITVALEPSGSVRARTRGQHPYASIDRAAERIGDLMRRRTAQPLSS